MSWVDELQGDVVSDPEILATYAQDHAAPGLLTPGAPAALVRPKTTSEVQAAVRVAATHGVPVVPRGAGTGLSGGANAIEGCLVIALERMTSILDLDTEALTATVEPGVINLSLREAAAAEGLLFAPDPASFDISTLGGNVATNAGGLCCNKYGVIRDSLLDLEVVLADGRAVTVGRRTRKGVTGYDLAGLMCGSEGTLGIVTRASFRLLPLPPTAHTLAASFPRLVDAGEAVARICRKHRPSLLEIMDRTTIDAVERMQPMDLDPEAEAMLFAQSDAGVAAASEIEAIGALCEGAGASLVVVSDEAAEGRMLLAARRLAYTALEQVGLTLLDDVAVPLPAIVPLLRGVAEIAARHEVLIGTFGHAGDGNMHPTIVYAPDEVDRARAAFDDILQLAVSLGGTVTGEHGVGVLKREAASVELADSLDLQAAVKAAFDPGGVFNPGKVL